MKVLYTILFIALTLGSISTFIELLKDKNEDPEERQSNVNYIHKL